MLLDGANLKEILSGYHINDEKSQDLDDSSRVQMHLKTSHQHHQL